MVLSNHELSVLFETVALLSWVDLARGFTVVANVILARCCLLVSFDFRVELELLGSVSDFVFVQSATCLPTCEPKRSAELCQT